MAQITGARLAGANLQRQLTKIVDRQVRYAAERALNDTVYSVSTRMRKDMPTYIDRPIPWTQRSIMYEKSTGLKLQAAVYVFNEGSKGKLAPTKYLQYQVYGGGRRPKAFENALRGIGILRSGEYAVPAKDLKLDQYGNIPGAFINLVLSWFGAFNRYAGDASNMSQRRKAQIMGVRVAGGKVRKKDVGRPGFSAVNVKDGRYRFGTTLGSIRQTGGQAVGRLFLGGRTEPGRRVSRGLHLKPGIYSAKGIHGSDIKPLLVFTRQPLYRIRYPFEKIVRQLALRDFRNAFKRRLDEAIATMRPA